VSEGWQAVRLDGIDPVPVAGGLLWHPVRRTLGVTAFGVNAYTAPNAGDEVVEDHTERLLGHEEIYVVLSGRATFTLDGETVDAPAGTLVHVRDPQVRRAARAEEAGTAVLAVGGKPGEAYAPSPWEWFFYAERYRPAEDWDAAVAYLEQGLAEHPGNAGMLYSLACYEALAGRREQALAHLQEAAAIDPGVAAHAAGDADLDAIRDLPGFPSPSSSA
jgi:quercetin dioxygenase-like cupin family protein